ncbi:MAG: NAD(+)/NADH kinase [Nitrososphaerota archaeon]
MSGEAMASRYFIIYSGKKPTVIEKVKEIEEFIKSRGFIVDSIQIDEVMENGIPADIEALIVLGGDGTLLKSISRLPRSSIPILTINYGRGGYLMNVEPENSIEAVEKILEGRYLVEKTLMLSFKAEGRKIGNALNEAYISPAVPGKIMEFTIMKKGTVFYSGICDALIISTPIGSTAYAFSAGGPAVDNTLESAVIVPVCPLTNTRPVVLAIDEKFIVMAQSRFNLQVLIDGHIQSVFGGNIKLEVEKSEDHVLFINFEGYISFARRIQKRFK